MKLNTCGFTLIETLLVVALIMIVTGLSLPIARTLQTTNDVDVAAISLAQNARYAQQLAKSGVQDDGWGIKVNTGSIVVYRGATYATRDSGFDQSSSIASTIVPTGITEFNFAKASGNPDMSGAITLTGLNGKAVTLTVTSKGTVLY